MLDKHSIKGLASTAKDLDKWAKTDFASYILREEQRIFSTKYASLPGYRFMHLGLTSDKDVGQSFSQIHRFNIQSSNGSTGASAISDLSELPLPSDVVDVVLLQHTLEFSVSPQSVLAEACRVVAPGGHLLICVMNPLGPLGLTKLPLQFLRSYPWYQFHSLRAGRLLDWLSLLNFEVAEINHGAYRWPFRYRSSEKNLEADPNQRPKKTWDQFCQGITLPLGNFYMIHGVKRVGRGVVSSSLNWKSAARGHIPRSASHSIGAKKSKR